MPIELGELDHVAIAVRDLDAAITLYGALGMTYQGRERVAEQGVEVAFFGEGAGRIELVCPFDQGTGSTNGVAKFLEKRGEGLHHLCLAVPDLKGALATLKSTGMKLLDEVPRPGAAGSLIAFLHPKSTGGVLLELKERGVGRAPS